VPKYMWITATALFYAWEGREVLEISTGGQSHIGNLHKKQVNCKPHLLYF
jgi:hypothetical protein